MMKENPTTEIKLQQTNTSKKDNKSKGRKNVRKVNSKKKERKKSWYQNPANKSFCQQGKSLAVTKSLKMSWGNMMLSHWPCFMWRFFMIMWFNKTFKLIFQISHHVRGIYVLNIEENYLTWHLSWKFSYTFIGTTILQNMCKKFCSLSYSFISKVK